MLKRVNCQEGDLGQKRDLGIRVALEKCDKGKRVALQKGEMVADRMATRSNGISQDPLSSSESDQLLLTMFLEWAKRLEKNYKSEEEQKERFLIWCSTKKKMEERNSHKPGCISPSDLNIFADMKASEIARQTGGCRFEEDPYEGRPPVLNLWKTKEGLEEVKKAKLEFDKLLQSMEETIRARVSETKGRVSETKGSWPFWNKRRVDCINKVSPGFWTQGYSGDCMDKWFWEN